MTSVHTNDELIADALEIFDDEYKAWHLIPSWGGPMPSWTMRRLNHVSLAELSPAGAGVISDSILSYTDEYTDEPLQMPKEEADAYFEFHRRAEAMGKVLDWAFAL